jgi:hypothetical protein
MMQDKRARDILIEAFWKNGWKPEAERSVAPEDFAYARRKGYMFDPVAFTHDQAVVQLVEVRERVARDALSNSFLASLTSRRLDRRSALGSYAFALNFPRHEIAATQRVMVPSGAQRCALCGFYEREKPAEIDLNVLNFERHKWGGVRRDDPVYAWLDLSLFAIEEPQEPSDSDTAIMRQILNIAGSLPAAATASSLEAALAGIFKSSKQERRVVVEILSVCGVLQTTNRVGYFGEFAAASEREHTGQHHNDWGYPARWWRGADGVNEAAVSALFPAL